MRTLLALGGLAAVLIAGPGCRSHVAGRCDCENHPEAALVAPPVAGYPVIGGPAPATTVPPVTAPVPSTSVGPNGAMGGASPMTMPAPEKLPK